MAGPYALTIQTKEALEVVTLDGQVQTEPVDLSPVVHPVDAGLVIYRPGGVAGGNVYTSLALACAALLAGDGPRELYFDNSAIGGATMVLPAGSFNHGPGVTWRGNNNNKSGLLTTVAFSAGTTFVATPCSFEGMALLQEQAATPFRLADQDGIVFEDVALVGTSGGPMFLLPGGTGGTVSLYFKGAFESGATVPVLKNADAPSLLEVFVSDFCRVAEGFLDPASTGPVVFLVADAAQVDVTNLPPTCPSAGLAYASVAPFVGYTPTAGWGPSSPQTVQAALDDVPSILGHRDDVFTSSGVGATATWTEVTPFTCVGPGKVRLSLTALLSTPTTPGSAVQLTLERDSAPITITVQGTTDADGNWSACMVFVDTVPAGPHTYRALASTAAVGGCQFTSAYMVVEETF